MHGQVCSEQRQIGRADVLGLYAGIAVTLGAAGQVNAGTVPSTRQAAVQEYNGGAGGGASGYTSGSATVAAGRLSIRWCRSGSH